jgi:hypothetical protein
VLSAATGSRAFALGLVLGLGSVGLLLGRGTDAALDGDYRGAAGRLPCLALAAALAGHAVWASLSPATAPGARPLHAAARARMSGRASGKGAVSAAASGDGDFDDWSGSEDGDDAADRGYLVLAVRDDDDDDGALPAALEQQQEEEEQQQQQRGGRPVAVDPTEGAVNGFVCPPPPAPPPPDEVAAEARLWTDARLESSPSRGHGNGSAAAEAPAAARRVVPARVLRGVKGDAAEAKKRCAATALWRQAYAVDGLFTGVPADPAFDLLGSPPCGALALGEPQPFFAAIKRYYPHTCHGTTPAGHLVYLEQVGVAAQHLHALQARVGVSLPQLLRHKVTHEEYLWRVVASNRADAQAVTLFDLAGLTMASVGALAKQDACKAVVDVCKEHYVER